MTVSVVIPHYYQQRRENITTIVRAHNTSTRVPDEIIIWNNDHPFDVMPQNVKVIQAFRNVGCSARFLAAMTAQSDFVLFQDNDVCTEPDTLAHLMSFYKDFPGRAICALEGRYLLPSKSYAECKKVDGLNRSTMQPIHISLGRLELVTKRVVNDLLSYIPFSDTDRYDDILFSHAAEQNGVPRFVVPYLQGQGYINLNEHGVGAWYSANHMPERDALCREFWPEDSR
jgi:hypothetical protein